MDEAVELREQLSKRRANRAAATVLNPKRDYAPAGFGFVVNVSRNLAPTSLKLRGVST